MRGVINNFAKFAAVSKSIGMTPDNKTTHPTGQLAGQKFTVAHDGTLLKYLYEIFPTQSKKGVKGVLGNGQVVLNGKGTTAFDMPLKAGDTIVVLPKGVSIANEVREAVRTESKEAGVEVVYEDDYIIVVNKEAGIPVVGTGKSAGKPLKDQKGGKAAMKSQVKEVTVYSVLSDYMKTKGMAERHQSKKVKNFSATKVFIVHRLDRDTSGLLVFAKDEKTKTMLQSSWNSLVKERSYVAVLEGVPTKERGVVVSWLKENDKSYMVTSSQIEGNGAKAVTHYQVLLRSSTAEDGMSYSLVKFDLETGRKNQIRVHAASEMGHPVAGDRKYGAKTNPCGRLALHARTLVFRHPVTGELLNFDTPLPKSFNKPF